MAVEDVAEIPTFQRKSAIDPTTTARSPPPRRPPTRPRSAPRWPPATTSPSPARRRLAGRAPSPTPSGPGAIRPHDRPPRRAACSATADLSAGATVALHDNWDGDGIGWHEITAVGTGVSLKNSPVPATSISDDPARVPQRPAVLAARRAVDHPRRDAGRGQLDLRQGQEPAGRRLRRPRARTRLTTGVQRPGRPQEPRRRRRRARGAALDAAGRGPRVPARPRQDGHGGLPRRQGAAGCATS